MSRKRRSVGGVITVLAGVNGAGKSSIAGAWLRRSGGDYFNPDEWATRIRERDRSIGVMEANSQASIRGKEGLEEAIRQRSGFVFETTLGGATITAILLEAARSGVVIRVWFVGLTTVEDHLRRVDTRVAEGGHDIPEEKIRERWDSSRLNLIRLLPYLDELIVWDNSIEADFRKTAPKPILVLHFKAGSIVAPKDLSKTPEWAKPIVAVAMKKGLKIRG